VGRAMRSDNPESHSQKNENQVIEASPWQATEITKYGRRPNALAYAVHRFHPIGLVGSSMIAKDPYRDMLYGVIERPLSKKRAEHAPTSCPPW
jgi:hypothetical protein